MNENNMKNSPENAPASGGRRKAIKKIAVGVGVLAGYSVLPDKWIKPIVGRIVLPAHAQTSGVTICPDLTLTIVSGDTSSSTVSIHVAGCVIPPTANQPIAITINGGSGCVFSEQLSTDGAGNFSGNFDVPCGPGIQTICASAHVSNGPGVTACVDDPQPGKKNDGTQPAPHPPAPTTPHPTPTTPTPCPDTNVTVGVINLTQHPIQVSYSVACQKLTDILKGNISKQYAVKDHSFVEIYPYDNKNGIIVKAPGTAATCVTSMTPVAISGNTLITITPCSTPGP